MSVPSKRVRNNLFNDLKGMPGAFQRNDDPSSLLEFLSVIWELRLMPSTDERFQDAHGDIYQHMVNNYDWDYDFLFLEILKLLDAPDETFQKFLEAIVDPKFRTSEEEIFRYVLLINDHIDQEGILLAIEGYDDMELPIHKVKPKSQFEHSPSDLKKNTIPFFVPRSIKGKSKYLSSHAKPSIFPSFVLAFNEGWNDYSSKTSFDLFYYDEEGQGMRIGPLKIIVENWKLMEENYENAVHDILKEKFTDLDENYCSLGTSEAYYTNLKEILKRDLESVLFALRDMAFFPENRERFETNPLLKNSLIRYEDTERLSRQVRYRLYGYDLSNLYKFKYFFKPPYSDGTIDVNLDFSAEGDIPSRIFALIGKNGTGKTQLIASLPLHIARKEDKRFSPRAPLFSKVIAVSYSIFDRFEIPRKSSSFNYVYCGLRNDQGEIMTDRGQTQRFHNTWKKIQLIGRVEKWRKFLLLFLEESLVNEMIVLQNEDPFFSRDVYKVDATAVSAVRKKLSSGQNILLNLVSEIVANIMYDSIILFDEPETHLHPNAVSQLINTIYELVTEFQSYCLIATHSPLVIRELVSKNVLVIERHENEASVRRIGTESFGENLSVLTEEVFGNREIPKHYKSIMEDLVSKGHSFEEIVSMVETTGSPLSLNARIYLRSLLS